jgi:hypothetical protein
MKESFPLHANFCYTDSINRSKTMEAKVIEKDLMGVVYKFSKSTRRQTYGCIIPTKTTYYLVTRVSDGKQIEIVGGTWSIWKRNMMKRGAKFQKVS